MSFKAWLGLAQSCIAKFSPSYKLVPASDAQPELFWIFQNLGLRPLPSGTQSFETTCIIGTQASRLVIILAQQFMYMILFTITLLSYSFL